MIKNTKTKESTHVVHILFINGQRESWYADNETTCKHIFYKLSQTQEIISIENEQWYVNRSQVLEVYCGTVS